MKSNIRKIGNSAGVILSQDVLNQVHLTVGKEIVVTVEGNNIVIAPTAARPRYTLKALLSQCNKRAPKSDELTEWDRMKPVGREKL